MCFNGTPTKVCDLSATSQCSGSLIQRDRILSAAHCYCDILQDPDAFDFKVTFQLPHDIEVGAPPRTVIPPTRSDLHLNACFGVSAQFEHASTDLAVLTLQSIVPENEARSPLLDPYLGSNFRSQGWSAGPRTAGYGGMLTQGDEGFPLLTGRYAAIPKFKRDTFLFWEGAWWIEMPADGVLATAGGDSGGPLIWRAPDGHDQIVGVLSIGNDDTSTYSPTWNNGDGNGNFIAPYLTDVDLDGDRVSDVVDNCSPTKLLHAKCAVSPLDCANLDQVDGDRDGIGDVCDSCPNRDNPTQDDSDGDGIGDICDGCPLAKTDSADSDGDGVWDACDNCVSAANGYKFCAVDTDCTPGVCIQGHHCSLQLDDTDGDGAAAACDTCTTIASPGLQENSNPDAETREGAGHLQDVCDPVPVYASAPEAVRSPVGGGWDPDVNERNPANTLQLRGAALFGHDAALVPTPTPLGNLPRKTFNGTVGFRHCDCLGDEGGVLSRDVCLGRCNLDPRLYDDDNSRWQPITVGFDDDKSLDSDPKAEFERTYTSDTFVDPLERAHLGTRETLYWTYWNDLVQNGGEVRSYTADGVLQTAGIFWSHTLPLVNASGRDSSYARRLRDAYQAVITPYFTSAEPPQFFPRTSCVVGGGCRPWLNPLLDPDPKEIVNPRGIRGIIEDLGRIDISGDRIGSFREGIQVDITALTASLLRELIAAGTAAWASPTESSTRLIERRIATQFVAVESPWTGLVPIREFATNSQGRLDLRPLAPTTGIVPGPRTGAQILLSAEERVVYMLGGKETVNGQAVPVPEIWRYALDTGRWQRVEESPLSRGAALVDVSAAAYDSSRHLLFTLGRGTRSSTFYTTTALRLTSIDSRTGAASSLATLPSLAGLSGTSVAAMPNGNLVLAVQAASNTVQLFELNPRTQPMAWIGYAALSGKLDDRIIVPGNVQVPILVGTNHTVLSVSQAALAARAGANLVPDTDKDGRVDLLDDCPGTYNPAQQGCPVLADSVLYAAHTLTLRNSVQVSAGLGNTPLLVSAGTAQTSIGIEARVGTIYSLGGVKLLDRAHASGSVTSGGTVQLINGATIAGAKNQNAKLGLEKLTALSIPFPPNQGPVMLEPDQKRTLAPGSYAAVSVKSRATLTLKSGDYYFDALHALEPQSTIVVDTRNSLLPVRIFVKSALTFRGRIADVTSARPEVLVVYQGTAVANVESAFNGTLVAPVAKVLLGTTTRPHVGAFFANQLEVSANGRVQYARPVTDWLP